MKFSESVKISELLEVGRGAQLSLDNTITVDRADRNTMPLSFDEYRNIWWRSEIGAGQPAKYDTYKKFKQLSASDCETAIKQLIYEKPDESETTLTPKNKCSWESYVSPHCH